MTKENQTWVTGGLLALVLVLVVVVVVAMNREEKAPTFGEWLAGMIGGSAGSFGTAWDNWGDWFGKGK